eukprot:CAMPEP_0206223888 /NCGR_PEP_ID=MMETSP0047_2-20121206/6727_1 /ASSEMBLY_ACC=CAM_ASM_000192 /TAXON_ID=195065 /ORGANISM="Chroomonas mesostigmatica_cf, Strain CCMP1168" /LENGTH=158 /DNA_ID=CAMNT_0053646797 /DNA_START=12 /DNA_END=488 /DNA_ORIENTATION=-
MMQGPSGVCPVLELDVERSHAHQQAGHEQQPPLVRADANKVRKPHEVAEGVDCNCCEQLASSEEDVTHKSTKERRVGELHQHADHNGGPRMPRPPQLERVVHVRTPKEEGPHKDSTAGGKPSSEQEGKRTPTEDPFFCDGGEDVVADLLQLLLGLPEV